MIKGFNDKAREAGTRVTGGQTVLNPWPIIGGVAMTVCNTGEFVLPEGAEPGNVLVLTKPIGTQLAVNGHQWMHKPEKWSVATERTGITQQQALEAYKVASAQMARLNRNAARLMRVHGATAATDVTGFGLYGHCNNLAQNQRRSDLVFRLNRVPVIRHTLTLLNAFPGVYKLREGLSAETSGGLLVCLPTHQAAEQYIADLKAADGTDAWIVGQVEVDKVEHELSRAVLEPNAEFFEV